VAQYWCPTCHQFYSEAGYCPFDGGRLSIAPEAISHQPRAISAHDGEDAVRALLQTDSGALYERLVGQTLDGRYLIERKIGEGGMGVVYAARHLVIERPLAVKVLKREVARDQSTIKRFVQEAKAASRIGHPHIVDVTDFGTTPDGLTYSVMEYVDGSTLSSVIKLSAPLALERILPIAAQIAQALDAAHQKGIVHRDLKPENIFLINRDGRRDFVKIVDFGIAKVTPIDSNAPSEGPRLTRAGAVFGTPEYMAPEQAAGRSDTDGRVDVYALGTIMYEMLTGRVPHKSESMVRTLAMQMLDPIEPPSRVRPDVPIAPEVEAVVMRALAKKREQRYQTMSELYDAIKSVAGTIDLAQPVSSSVTAQKHVLQLQPLPPGAAGPGDETIRPPRATMESAPPPPLAPVTASDTDIARARRPVNEPAFVTREPRAETFQIHDDEPAPVARSRWPIAVGAVLLFGAAGVAAALFLAKKDKVVENVVDASVVAEVTADVTADAGNVVEVPVDGSVIVEIPMDAGAEDAGKTVGIHNRKDAGVVAIGRNDGGIGRTPGERGNVSIEVITRPDGGILYIDQSYRGPGGTHLEERRGSRVKVKCTLPGYDPGYLDLVFDGKTEVAICTMTRTVKCIPGIKNPFDDCPD
jgi:serine/threonine protein kinase